MRWTRRRLWFSSTSTATPTCPGPLSPEQTKQLWRRSAELIEAERPGGENVYLDGKSQRVWNLVNKGRLYEEMIQLPQVLELQQHLLGDDCTLKGKTQQQAADELGHSRKTIAKALAHSSPPGYRRQKPLPRPTLDSFFSLE